MRRLLCFLVSLALSGLVLPCKDPVESSSQCDEPLVGRANQPCRTVKAVENRADDIQPFQKGSNGLGLVNPGLFLIRF